jgi:UDP-N-acetylmuramate: L-alanyl-gamma-D-glutamyl-meso-diaminopimelate ligase
MKVHILGIGGTFMGSIALLAQSLGFDVSGTDDMIFPPMADMLKNANIKVGTHWEQPLKEKYDWIIVGNTLSRSGKGKTAIEVILNHNLPYISGPQWLYENVLRDRNVIAVAGTHGKTSTTSLLAWIFKTAKIDAGFLIGGMPKNFGVSAHLGRSPFFIIEADEYDTAFFDKRSKFLHYRPQSLILNNLEFDHADIFENLQAIQKQFTYLLRTVPSSGKIIYSDEDKNLKEVLSHAYSQLESAGIGCGDWRVENIHQSNKDVTFEVYHQNKFFEAFRWTQYGEHYIHNALNAIAMAHQFGIKKEVLVKALQTFDGVKRRLEVISTIHNVTIYDDFAHHPTAIQKTIQALKSKIGDERLIVVLFCETNTLKSGYYNHALIKALFEAEQAYVVTEHAHVDALQKDAIESNVSICSDYNIAIDALKHLVKSGDHLLVMSTRSIKPFLEKFSTINIGNRGGVHAN